MRKNPSLLRQRSATPANLRRDRQRQRDWHRVELSPSPTVIGRFPPRTASGQNLTLGTQQGMTASEGPGMGAERDLKS